MTSHGALLQSLPTPHPYLLPLLSLALPSCPNVCLQVLPVAFVASHDEVTAVASAWAAVWSQGCPSEPAALRLHAAELAGLLAGGLGSSAWPRKRAAAKVSSGQGVLACVFMQAVCVQ